MCTSTRRFVCTHVYQHVFKAVHRRAYGRVYRHVRRHLYRDGVQVLTAFVALTNVADSGWGPTEVPWPWPWGPTEVLTAMFNRMSNTT